MTREVVIPAPAQGVLAIEAAEVNTELLDKINALSDDNSDREAVAERTFLRLTGGGCHAPVGAHCVTKENGDLRMVVLFGNDDCSRILRIEVTGTDSEGGWPRSSPYARIGVDCGAKYIYTIY